MKSHTNKYGRQISSEFCRQADGLHFLECKREQCWWTTWKRVRLLLGPPTLISEDSYRGGIKKIWRGKLTRRVLYNTRATLQPTSPQGWWLPSRDVALNSSNTHHIHLIWHSQTSTSSSRWWRSHDKENDDHVNASVDHFPSCRTIPILSTQLWVWWNFLFFSGLITCYKTYSIFRKTAP